jgi:hypothetical protein
MLKIAIFAKMAIFRVKKQRSTPYRDLFFDPLFDPKNGQNPENPKNGLFGPFWGPFWTPQGPNRTPPKPPFLKAVPPQTPTLARVRTWAPDPGFGPKMTLFGHFGQNGQNGQNREMVENGSQGSPFDQRSETIFTIHYPSSRRFLPQNGPFWPFLGLNEGQNDHFLGFLIKKVYKKSLKSEQEPFSFLKPRLPV